MGDKENGTNGVGTWGILIVLFLLFIVFGGGFGALGNRGVLAAEAVGGCGHGYGCDRVSNCEVERQEIIDTYNTQLNTINQGIITRKDMQDGFEMLRQQSRGQYDAQQGEKIFDLKMENQALKQNAFVGAEFCALNRRLDTIECGMPKSPPYYARGYVPDGQCIPRNCGNGCNNGCGGIA